MGDRYRTADGWAVEVVELRAPPDRNHGERLKVTYCGFFVALVRTVAEPETWFPLADLEPETLTPWHQMAMALQRPSPQCRRAEGCCRREKTDTCTVAAIVALAEERTLMSTDPETRLALAAAVQRLANWTGAAMPPSPATVVTIAQARTRRARRGRARHPACPRRRPGLGDHRVAARPGRLTVPRRRPGPARVRLLRGPGPVAGV
jgi:hypothetical protein